jgi:hypothetical protein
MMDFVLRYRGPLHANGGPKGKHRIRLAVHGQLENLCAQEPLLEQAKKENLPTATMKGRQMEVQRPITEGFFFGVPIGGFEFVPIIHRPHELVCALDILFLRREKPGAIVSHGGDLDNRLKTLFDALRMPHDESELCGITPENADQRLYCLLEDDALITRVSVSTQQLFEPLASDENESTVELLIHVWVQSVYPMWANMGF